MSTLTFSLFLALIFPVSAATYNPGVSVGQYVKLGNYWGIGDETLLKNPLAMDWLRFDIVSVNGKEVTLVTSAMFKNGTSKANSTETYNIEAGTMSSRYLNNTPYTNGPIIASNLSQGDNVPPLGDLKINRTQNAVYLGVTRTVNIVNSTWTTLGVTTNYNLVYDQITGLMLEIIYESNQTTPTSKYVKYGSSVVETNITGSVIPEYAPLTLFVATTLLASLAALFRGKLLFLQESHS